MLSVVIPALDEAARLPRLLEDLRALALPHEVVVCDGGSRDGTPAAAAAAGARVVAAPAGRGRQLRAGISAARGEWLMVLHADARLSPAALAEAAALVAAGDAGRYGAWPLRYLHARRAFRLVEFGAGLRWRLLGLAYGDQGLVLHRSLYERAGGYPDEPLMEDVALARALRRTGRAVRFRHAIGADPRRYLRQGVARRALGNVALVVRHLAGVPASRLARQYPPEPTDLGPSVHLLLKAPRPGTVKTRLAASIGDEAAVALYRGLAERTLAVVRATGWPCTVWYAPRDAEAECRAWLGGDVRLRPQPDGDLGARMAHAVASEAPGRATVLLGGDCPGLTPALLHEASSALQAAPVVLGPSEDGGYWLLGARTPAPPLFEGVAWSTPAVLAETRRRLETSGVEWVELATLRDVDTLEDARAAGLVG